MAHITDIPYINNSNIDYMINCLNEQLIKKYKDKLSSFSILIVGGSALALKYNYRSTVDIDADIKFQAEITSCINTVAEQNNIPKDWINQDFTKSESYSKRLWQNAFHYKTFGFINVYVVSDLDQLCMKSIAGRRKDFKDIEFLCKMLKIKGITYNDYLRKFNFLYGNHVKKKDRADKLIKKLLK